MASIEATIPWSYVEIFFVFAILFLICSYFIKLILSNCFFVNGDDSEDENVTMSKSELRKLIETQVQQAVATALQPTATQNNVNGNASSSSANSGVPGLNGGAIAHVAFRSPQPLHLQNPAVWFLILEQQFLISNITQEATKYSHAVSNLDSRLHNTFADLIIRDKGTTPYSTFKTEVIKYLGESEKSKLNNLLHGLTLGDQKPSQLLSKLKANAGDTFADDPLRQLWMSRLPQVQIVLTAFENDVSLAVLAQRADNVKETMSHISTNSSGYSAAATNYCIGTDETDSSNKSDLNTKLITMKSEIISEISALWNKSSENRSRNNSRDRSSSRTRSPSNDNRNSDTCFYHRRFGDKAQKCISSCKYHKDFMAEHKISKN